ncbi:MAG TPA: ABC transporter ATP-binding protein [Jiangellaceae bacterium]|nr:ABC transporter ATP-binding protein [Jiangellaceae bacterium]
MRTLPHTHLGTPDTRSAGRFLLWLAARQWTTLVNGMVLGCVWMLAQALMPWAIGHAIDGIAAENTTTILTWTGVLLGLGLLVAVSAVLRHRAAVVNWLYSTFRTVQVITGHSAHTGPALGRTIPTGDVVATASSDSHHIGNAFEVTPRFAGAVASYAVVSVIVLDMSVTLGLMVVLGVPVLVGSAAPLIGPLRRRQDEQRDSLGELTSLGADTVAGLRVLRGLGGEDVFAQRYTARSQTVRLAGVRLASVQSLLDAVLVALPGLFLAALIWVGASMTMSGEIAPGTLVTLYGFAFFLLIPVYTTGEMVFVATRAMIAARRVVKVLAVERDVPDSATPEHDDGTTGPAGAIRPVEHDGPGELLDDASGLRVEPGRLSMVVADSAADAAALADRLGRMSPATGVRLDGVALDELPLDTVRRRVVVSDPEPTLFTGPLRTGLDPYGQHDTRTLTDALAVAAAADILDAIAEGLDGALEERGRSLSGGQRQRVGLARALVQDPGILVLVEPTSAVDAHTEATIAGNLRAARAARTTVVITASPLMLAQADVVMWLAGGRVAATGTHDELLHTVTDYHRTVIREEVEA